MYSVMKKLIEKKFYKSADEASNKVDVFYACNKLSDEEYAELTAMIAEAYPTEEPEAQGERKHHAYIKKRMRGR